MPNNLIDLYLYMLENVEPHYHNLGANFLQIVYHVDTPLSIPDIAFCDVVVNKPGITDAASEICDSKMEMHAICMRMGYQIKVTCLGLLEVAPTFSIDGGRKMTTLVRFMHQSVAE